MRNPVMQTKRIIPIRSGWGWSISRKTNPVSALMTIMMRETFREIFPLFQRYAVRDMPAAIERTANKVPVAVSPIRRQTAIAEIPRPMSVENASSPENERNFIPAISCR
jgi:hypothetical protein